LPKKYVDAIEQNALSRRVSGLRGGSSTWLRLRASSSTGGGGSRAAFRPKHCSRQCTHKSRCTI